MNIFSFFLLLIVCVLLALICFFYFSFSKKEALQQEQFNDLRQITNALDLQIEGFKLLFQKYYTQLPKNLLEEIEEECQKAQKKADNATSMQEFFNSKILEERWQTLQEWLSQNLKKEGHF